MSKRIKLELRQLDIPSKIKKAESIVACMTGNENFPYPDPTLSDLTKAYKDLETKYNEVQIARQTAQQKTAEMNASELELDSKLTHLATYVENKAKGNVIVIKSAGMDVRADSVPVGLPAKTEILYLTEAGHNGELKLKWSKVRGAKSYNIEISDNSKKSPAWTVFDTTTKTKAVIRNLTSGTRYCFRVQAIGAAGKGPYSEPITKFAP
jgi:hypothetical protein